MKNKIIFIGLLFIILLVWFSYGYTHQISKLQDNKDFYVIFMKSCMLEKWFPKEKNKICLIDMNKYPVCLENERKEYNRQVDISNSCSSKATLIWFSKNYVSPDNEDLYNF